MVKAVLVGALVILGLGWALMSLWNWLVPSLLGGSPVSLWQALGLLVLAKLLFTGWRYRGGGCHGRYRRAWKKKFEDKWNQMTPEEQEHFKHNFTRQCYRWRWSEPKDEDVESSDQVNAGS